MNDHDDPLLRALRPEVEQNREQKVHGVVTALVDKLEDNGGCRLRYFGMNGKDDDDPSAAARVAMPMAGAGRGVHFMPEAGDEVVVAFHNGDVNNPIILGSVYNSQSKPPTQAKQSPSNDVRTIVSRSGHELTLDDTAGAEKVTLKSKGGHGVVLEDAPGAPKVTVSSSGGRKITIDDTPPGKLTLETPTCRITLDDAGGILTIEATAAINLNAPTVNFNCTGLSLGSGAGSTMIDGVPFKLHTHPVLPGTTGPVNS